MTDMTEDEFNDATMRVANDFIDLYAAYCKHYPRQLVLWAMAGSIASLAIAHEFSQESVVAAITRFFHEIEKSPEAPEAPSSRAH